MPDDIITEQPGGDQAAAPAAPPAGAEAPVQDTEYWKNEAKKAFEARDRAKEETRLANQRPQYSAPAPAAPPAPEENLDELYWTSPTKVLEKILDRRLSQAVDPFYEDRYEMQKAKYANDPNFQRYAPQIDELIRTDPKLKSQPGVVDKLYRAVRAMEFDPDAERKRIEAEVIQRMQNKQTGSLESAGTPPGATPPASQQINLTDDEKRVAIKFNPSISADEAYKKYQANKSKWQQGA